VKTKERRRFGSGDLQTTLIRLGVGLLLSLLGYGSYTYVDDASLKSPVFNREIID